MRKMRIAANRSSHCKNPFALELGFFHSFSVSVMELVTGKDSGTKLPEFKSWLYSLFTGTTQSKLYDISVS